MPRLFVALDLPESVRESLIAMQQADIPDARWVRPEQMHLTMHFIGNVPDETHQTIQTSLAAVNIADFQMRLRGVGQFPPRGSARVLWAGIEAPVVLQTLHQAIAAALRPTGYIPEDRPFSPHITLARFKPPVRRTVLKDFFEDHADFETPWFPASAFVLYRSELRRSGAIYHRERVYPLI